MSSCIGLFVVVLATLIPGRVHAQSLGKYIGLPVQAVWEGPRNMRLLAPLTYIDPKGVEWQAPTGSLTDGASIPPIAWGGILGGPFEGLHREAAVIHDVACRLKRRPWQTVHETFYWAMLASGVETWRAKVMYGGVYHFGPRWPSVVDVRDLPVGAGTLATQEALRGAEPDSTARVTDMRRRYRIVSGKKVPTGRADFVVSVEPPSPKLSEDQFGALRRRIEELEPSAGGGLSLDQIRAHQPELRR